MVSAKRKWSEERIEIAKDLRWAIQDKDAALVKQLCSQNDYLILDQFPGFDDNPLALAVEEGDKGIVELLIAIGFSVNPALPESETLPLEMALRDGDKADIVECLLSHGANPNNGRPIIAAINIQPESTALRFVKQLVEHGCDVNRIYDLYGDFKNGFTALDWASEKPEIAEYLRRQGGLSAAGIRSGKRPSDKSATKSPPSETVPDEVVAYFEKTVGPASKKSLIQIVPTGLPIGIHVIPPQGNRKHMTLFTNGLSAEPMQVPEGAEEYQYAELFIELPGDWQIKQVKDMRWAWPLFWLRKLAQYPHNADTWLGGPVSLISNEEPPQPLWPGRQFTALLLFAESSFQRSDGHTVQLYRVLPLYPSEREYELKHGLQRFMQALDKHEVPTIVDVHRKPFA